MAAQIQIGPALAAMLDVAAAIRRAGAVDRDEALGLLVEAQRRLRVAESAIEHLKREVEARVD